MNTKHKRKWNEYQQRILDNSANSTSKGLVGKYLFFGVPNNQEGQDFMDLVKKYLNPIMRLTKAHRKWGSWGHSVSSQKADSFCVYAKEKPTPQSKAEKEREMADRKEDYINKRKLIQIKAIVGEYE